MATAVEISEIIRNYGILVGGFFGLGIAVWRGLSLSHQARASEEQAAIARRDHITELYGRAVGQLGDDRFEVRLGAIYTLERIGDDFPDFSAMVIELLGAYLRERSSEYNAEEPPADVRAVLRIVGGRERVTSS